MHQQKIMSEKSASILIGLGFLTLASSLVFFLYKIEIFNLSQPIDAAKFGQFGDTIGGVVGSLWTLASVILFYTSLQQQKIITTNSAHSIKQQGDALLIQSEELKRQNEALRIQIEELQLTRKEHSLSRAVHQEQTDINKELSEIHKKNSFENSFYAIMNIYNNIQTELVYEKDLFNKIKNEMLDKYPNYSRYRTCFKHSMELYTTIYFRNKDRISQHLKTIYRILKTIDSAPIKDDLKFYYSKILRAQLTEPELFIIYYNSHSPMGLNLRTLLIKYNILKHLLITNKAEFRKFTLHNEVNYKIQLFIEKLDLEMEKAFRTLNDIESNADEYEFITSTESPLFSVRIDDESKNILIKTCKIDDRFILSLRTERHRFIQLMEHYVCDRFASFRILEDEGEKINNNVSPCPILNDGSMMSIITIPQIIFSMPIFDKY